MVLKKLNFGSHEFSIDPRREYIRIPDSLSHLSDDEKVRTLEDLRQNLADLLEAAAAAHIRDSLAFEFHQENAA